MPWDEGLVNSLVYDRPDPSEGRVVSYVLAINEGNLIIEGDKSFVEVETGPQQYEKREIKTGLSDGINIEVVSGLTADQKIKHR